MNYSVCHGLRAAFYGRLLTDDADMAPFLADRCGQPAGRALAVAEPDTAEDVAAILRFCDAHEVPVLPQGGNSGKAGSSVPGRSRSPLVLSLARLNRIRSIDPVNYTMTVEAGCTLQQIQEVAGLAGSLFPLSLAADGSCTIGGRLAANARGGVQVLRFGSARELCLGLEVVTPQGELWNGLSGLRRASSAQDLRDLYIGSEGTLGVITAAVLKLSPMPAARVAALVAVPSPEAALTLFTLARARLDASLTAFELMSASCLDLVLKHLPDARRPLESDSPWYALLETSGMWGEHEATELMESVLGEALDDRLVSDAVVSTSAAHFEALWALRENILEAQAAEGSSVKLDISLPVPALPEFIERTGMAIHARYPDLRQVVFGHMANGELHYNVLPPVGHAGAGHLSAFTEIQQALNKLVQEAAAQRGGSISAEHGARTLHYDEATNCRDEVERRLMRTLKVALDPKGLMNPGRAVA